MKWIKCSDQMPPNNLSVLVYDKDGVHGGSQIDIDYRVSGEFWNDGGIFDRISHWMQLPNPPKE